MSNINQSQKDTIESIKQVNVIRSTIRRDTPLIKKSSNPYFTNPLTGRTINNNTRSRYNVNRNIKKANEELQQQRIQEQRNNKFGSATIIGGLSNYLKVRIDTKNINNTRDLFNFLTKNLETGRRGYVLNNISISFVNDSNQVIWRTINASYVESNDFDIFNAYINDLYNGEAIGSDSINSDEFKLDLSHIDFTYLQSGMSFGDSDDIIFEIEDVNSIEGNKPNECIKNSLKFIGHELPYLKNKFIEVVNSKGDVDVVQEQLNITNITFLIKYIQEHNLAIDIISNTVQDIKLKGFREKFLIGQYKKLKFGYKLNQCEYKLNYLHFTGKEYPCLFVYDSKSDL
jgi:hypothetical protein